MRQMMRSFSEPFGGPSMPSIMDGRGRGHDMAEHPGSSVALRDEHRVSTCISRSTCLKNVDLFCLLVDSSDRQLCVTVSICVCVHD